jgi:hypothetical protein
LNKVVTPAHWPNSMFKCSFLAQYRKSCLLSFCTLHFLTADLLSV